MPVSGSGSIASIDYAAVAAQQLLDLGRRLLVPVDLAGLQGGGRGRGIDDDVPFDTVEMRDLGPGRQARLADRRRDVVGVALIDDEAAGIEFIRLELERTGADRLAHLGERVGLRDALRHDEGRAVGDLAKRLEQQREGPLQPEADAAVVDHLDRIGDGRELLAERIAPHPAGDRGHHVLRAHRLAIVELQPRPQRDGDDLAAILQHMPLGHLRLRREIRVEAIEAVVDHVPVVAGDVRRRPDRVEAGQVRLRHHLQDAVLRRLRGREARQCGCGPRGGGGPQQVTTVHVWLPAVQSARI